MAELPIEACAAARPGYPARLAAALHRAWDGDLAWSFRHSPVTIVAAVLSLGFALATLLAPVLAPHNPFDLATITILDASLPPSWLEGGDPRFLLGTDDQGRDVLSTIMYGGRISLVVGVVSVALALVFGVGLGLFSGYAGGMVDAFIMRVAEIQLSFPVILVALLINGILRGVLPVAQQADLAYYVLVLSIGFSGWVQYARTVRGSTLVEKRKEYVQAALIIGIHPALIVLRHILPNVMGPVLVIATIHLALAIITEATLSFLGVGVPPTEPSLGTLIRIGNDFLFSGEWWMSLFPGAALALFVLAVNLLGDWLRDALNPKLR